MKKFFCSSLILLISFLLSCKQPLVESAKTGSISGRVVCENAEDVSGIDVFLVNSESAGDARTLDFFEKETSFPFLIRTSCKTDKDGSFKITDIDEGNYIVYAYCADSVEKVVSSKVIVRANEYSVVDNLKLTPTGAIAGKITLDGSENDSFGFIVYVAGTSYSAPTDKDGSFMIPGIPAKKDYSVIIQRKMNICYTESGIEVEAFQKYELDPIDISSSEIYNEIGMYKVLHKIKYLGSDHYEELFPEQIKVGYVGALTNAISNKAPNGYHAEKINQLVIKENDVVEVIVYYEVNGFRKYTVRHWLQNTDLETYTECKDKEDILEWHYSFESKASPKNFDGFIAQDFSQVEVNEDGTSEVNIYYNRKTVNIYLNCETHTISVLSGSFGCPVEYDRSEIESAFITPLIYNKRLDSSSFTKIPDIFPSQDKIIFMDYSYITEPKLVNDGLKALLDENNKINGDGNSTFEMEWEFNPEKFLILDSFAFAFLVDKTSTENSMSFIYSTIGKIKLGNNNYSYTIDCNSLTKGHIYDFIILLDNGDGIQTDGEINLPFVYGIYDHNVPHIYGSELYFTEFEY